MTQAEALQRLRQGGELIAETSEIFDYAPVGIMRPGEDGEGVTLYVHEGGTRFLPIARYIWAELDAKGADYWAEWK